jgi:hypothetical protein
MCLVIVFGRPLQFVLFPSGLSYGSILCYIYILETVNFGSWCHIHLVLLCALMFSWFCWWREFLVSVLTILAWGWGHIRLIMLFCTVSLTLLQIHLVYFVQTIFWLLLINYFPPTPISEVAQFAFHLTPSPSAPAIIPVTTGGSNDVACNNSRRLKVWLIGNHMKGICHGQI